jgi:hypothetical protein
MGNTDEYKEKKNRDIWPAARKQNEGYPHKTKAGVLGTEFPCQYISLKKGKKFDDS